MSVTDVAVPEDFRRLGFSGLFWQEIEVDPAWVGSVPCLLSPGWLLLERIGSHGVVVRRDENAVVDLIRPGLRRISQGDSK